MRKQRLGLETRRGRLAFTLSISRAFGEQIMSFMLFPDTPLENGTLHPRCHTLRATSYPFSCGQDMILRT